MGGRGGNYKYFSAAIWLHYVQISLSIYLVEGLRSLHIFTAVLFTHFTRYIVVSMTISDRDGEYT